MWGRGGGKISMSEVAVGVCHVAIDTLEVKQKAANLVNELVDDVPQPLIG